MAPNRPDPLGGVSSINFQDKLLKVVQKGGGIGTMGGAEGAVGSGVAIKTGQEVEGG